MCVIIRKNWNKIKWKLIISLDASLCRQVCLNDTLFSLKMLKNLHISYAAIALVAEGLCPNILLIRKAVNYLNNNNNNNNNAIFVYVQTNCFSTNLIHELWFSNKSLWHYSLYYTGFISDVFDCMLHIFDLYVISGVDWAPVFRWLIGRWCSTLWAYNSWVAHSILRHACRSLTVGHAVRRKGFFLPSIRRIRWQKRVNDQSTLCVHFVIRLWNTSHVCLHILPGTVVSRIIIYWRPWACVRMN
jgi:hypothetical protein